MPISRSAAATAAPCPPPGSGIQVASECCGSSGLDDPGLSDFERHGEHAREHRKGQPLALARAERQAGLAARPGIRDDDAAHVRSGRTAIVTRLTRRAGSRRPSARRPRPRSSARGGCGARWRGSCPLGSSAGTSNGSTGRGRCFPPAGPDVRPHRGERLGDRRMDAAVHEADRLQHVLAHRNVPAHELVGRLVDLEAVVAVERRLHHFPHLAAKCEALRQ